jgi:hypothetical protein
MGGMRLGRSLIGYHAYSDVAFKIAGLETPGVSDAYIEKYLKI